MDKEATQKAKIRVHELINDINHVSQEAASNGLLDKECYVIPPHLHADLPETQRLEMYVMHWIYIETHRIRLTFLQRERRYEPRGRNRIQALERAIARNRATREAEDRDRTEMRARLNIWDDDESDELFYTDRVRWRTQRVRRLTAEEAADNEMRAFEAREAENLRRESEAFLARQMDEAVNCRHWLYLVLHRVCSLPFTKLSF